MVWLYTLCAVIGGTVLVCQFVLTLIGMGGDGDMIDDLGDITDGGGDFGAHAADGSSHTHTGHTSTNWLFGAITFRTVVAGLAFFGLAGRGSLESGLTAVQAFLIALAAGAAALYGVHWIMTMMQRLQEDSTVRIQRAVGKNGVVYLPIPGQKTGAGKVHLNLQNRSVEYLAMTDGDRIPSGVPVVVIEVLGPDTVKVAAASDAQSPSRSTVHA